AGERTEAPAQNVPTPAASRAQTGTDVLKRSSVPRLSGMRDAHDGLTAQTQARSAQKTTLRMAKMLSTTRRKVMAVKRYDRTKTCGRGAVEEGSHEGCGEHSGSNSFCRVAKARVTVLSRPEA